MHCARASLFRRPSLTKRFKPAYFRLSIRRRHRARPTDCPSLSHLLRMDLSASKRRSASPSRTIRVCARRRHEWSRRRPASISLSRRSCRRPAPTFAIRDSLSPFFPAARSFRPRSTPASRALPSPRPVYSGRSTTSAVAAGITDRPSARPKSRSCRWIVPARPLPSRSAGRTFSTSSLALPCASASKRCGWPRKSSPIRRHAERRAPPTARRCCEPRSRFRRPAKIWSPPASSFSTPRQRSTLPSVGLRSCRCKCRM
jgi:hypothetical protein